MIWDIVVVGFPVMWPLFACAFTWAAGLLTGAGFQRRVFYIAWAGSSLLDVALFLALRQWLEAAWRRPGRRSVSSPPCTCGGGDGKTSGGSRGWQARSHVHFSLLSSARRGKRHGPVLSFSRGRGEGVSVVILRGDAAHLPLPDSSVDLICTSPPYFSLRSYTDGGKPYAGQIGSEYTPWDYLEALWACTREWVRVLKPGGSLFVNLGDKYAQDTERSRNGLGTRRMGDGGLTRGGVLGGQTIELGRRDNGTVPRKSLLGLPWRYALGCVDQLGLILRAEIIWDKPSAMPESVTDRVRRSHEQVFHFTRNARYFAAADEIRQPLAAPRRKAGATAFAARDASHARAATGEYEQQNPLGALPGSVWEVASEPLRVPESLGVDHFAAYPAALVRKIIRGWSPRRICLECGAGRYPVSERRKVADRPGRVQGRSGDTLRLAHGADGRSGNRIATAAEITGYACRCTPFTDHPERREYHFDRWTPPPSRPALIVDPFAGTGTTMLTASVLGRIGIGVDRSGDYCRLARWRCSDPGERARALGVPKPPPVPDGQGSLFEEIV